MIYSLEYTDSIFGKTTGSVYNFVSLPSDAEQLKVVIRALYPEKRGAKMEFYTGNGLAMYWNRIKDSALGILVCLLCMVLGVVLTAYYKTAGHHGRVDSSVLYFGLFAIMLSTWIANETDFAMLMITNRTAASFFGYVLLMLVVPPFVLFFREFMEVEEHVFSSALCVASLLNFMINTTGHMAGIWYFKKTAIVTHVLLICAMVYMVYAIVWHIRHVGMDRKAKANLIGAVILGAALLIDIAAYYMEIVETDVIGKFGLLFYLLLMGSECTYEFAQQLEAGKKAEIYKELAVTDTLTGLFNRNAFDEWENTNTDFDNTMLVTFDLNNLKWCNDNLGHAAGDKYIIDAAEMIRQVFEKYGSCYRIGGDEFCVVIKEADKVEIEHLYKELLKKQEHYNEHSKDILMKIACGHAVFGERDKTIEETRSRADMRMYQNKNFLKNG